MIRVLLLCLLFWSHSTFSREGLTRKMGITILRIKHVAGCMPTITSGYRTVKDNIRVGGSPKSQHLKGNAIDFVLSCKDLRQTVQIAKMYCTGIGVYPKHVHCDLRKGKQVMWYGVYR